MENKECYKCKKTLNLSDDYFCSECKPLMEYREHPENKIDNTIYQISEITQQFSNEVKGSKVINNKTTKTVIGFILFPFLLLLNGELIHESIRHIDYYFEGYSFPADLGVATTVAFIVSVILTVLWFKWKPQR